ncbi:hypothetical protein ACA910_021850 [Epithemia clementina (nom. ined.)]
MSKSKSNGQASVDYGYGDSTDYGYGNDTKDYGYGNDNTDYGYGGGGNNDSTDYGYGETDYGYGDSYQAPTVEKPEPQVAPSSRRSSASDGPQQRGTRRHRSVRRNSCVIRKTDDDKLAVAEFLMGPPPMSDRDMQAAAQQHQTTQVTV